MSPLRLHIEGERFRDDKGREVLLRGINVAGDAKCPINPDQPSHVSEGFFDGDNVSFVGRPFTPEQAHTHFARLRRWGYNTIRYVYTWEAIEHAGPGKYDEEWISHTIEILRVAKKYGFYVFMDPHQDVWSRFSGGSGAPLWTIYACGLDPKNFGVTEAALVQNTHPKPEEFPQMIWATNYTRMACQVLFTLFFGGNTFAPKCIIDGKNIQDYLQDHFLAAVEHLAKRIKEAGDLEGDVVIGYESLNEPNRGLVGWQDISAVPKEQKLQKGTSPTAWQAMLTGSGRPCEIDTWEFGGMGPYKSGSALVDPEGISAWIDPKIGKDFDSKYGFKRDGGWRLGECIWAQHGVWEPKTDTLLVKDYFSKIPTTGQAIDYEYFTNHFFMHLYRKYSSMIRSVWPQAIMFCQPPVLEIPPTLAAGSPDADPNMVFAPHFYDGVTLMTKKWNKVWNVDVFGILRGKYLTPALAIKVGETAIRNCFRHQLKAIRDEGMQNMGPRPCVFTEFGIPYDMDKKHAYDTGDYTSQTAAMDANYFGMEGSDSNGECLWVYVSTNNHYWGDQWNGEDLSIVSQDDRTLPSTPPANDPQRSLSFSQSRESGTSAETPATVKATLSSENMTSSGTTVPHTNAAQQGYRAGEAYVRPSPVAVHGTITSRTFDLRNCTFSLTVHAPSPTDKSIPTEIFLPGWHFPKDNMSVELSGGKWAIDNVEGDMRVLKWWHAEGEQKITIRGLKRKANGMGLDEGEGGDEGYLKEYAKSCAVM